MKILKYLIVALLSLLLVACDQNIECVEAEDWGQEIEYTIPANNFNNFTVQPDYTEIGGWNSTGYVLTGDPIVAVVKNSVALASSPSCSNINQNCQASNGGYCYGNSWTAWYGNMNNSPGSGWNVASQVGLCYSLSGSGLPWCPTSISMSADIPVANIPCLFTRGLGLFAAVSDNYQDVLNPNNPFATSQLCASQTTTPNPNCFAHVGDNALSPPFYDNYCPAGGFIMNPPKDCNGGQCGSSSCQCGLNFKISDRYYSDNDGNYTLSFKQGLVSANPGVLTKFSSLVTGILCSSTTSLYKGIVVESNFISYVQALLVLYVASTGLAFIMGFVSFTSKELIIRVLKMAIILQIISPNSWEFFNNNFFSFFTNGVGEMTGILFGQGSQALPSITSSGSCAPNVAGIQAFDTAIAQLFSYDTTRKIMSLMVWKIYGFLYVAVIYLLILIILYAIIKSLLIFFVSYLAISILIVLAPIFITFFLFKITRRFFDNWLKNLISYFIQPIIILTFAFFMITILMNQLQFLFGYRVCWKEWFNIPVVNVSFYAWQSDYNDNFMACIPTPNAIMIEDDSGNYTIENAPGLNSCGATEGSLPGDSCMPYVCSQNRYIGFPYLDPNVDADISRINELQNGELLSFKDLVIMMLMIWFMVKFNDIVPIIAKRIGSAGGKTDISKVGSGMASGMGNLAAQGSYRLANPAYKAVTGGRDIKEDLISARRAITFEKVGPKEQELSEKKAQYNKLLSELKSEATNPNISLEAKSNKAAQIKELKNQMEDLQMGIKSSDYKKKQASDPNYGNIFERSAKTGAGVTQGLEEVAKGPGNMLLKIPTKIGQATVGKPLKAVKELPKTAVQKVMKAVRKTPGDGQQNTKNEND